MNASPLSSLATVSPAGRAHINHMYFAWSERFEVFWVSDPDSIHSRNLSRSQSSAVTIYDSHQTWGRPDRGIQLFGTARAVNGPAAESAERAYSRRFRDFDAEENDLPFYRFTPRQLKLFDERALDGGTLVTATVTRDGLAWLRTEVWT